MHSDTDTTAHALAAAYDVTPYIGAPHSLSHPALLGAFGRIYGLATTRPDACRVLELGCGDGSNIIPMAYEFPNSEFVGIDLSPVQINTGVDRIRDLRLDNIDLQAGNLMELDFDASAFDYIIAHGVYSWVPDRVKAKILEICRKSLTDQGMAYISYNVLPGWQFNVAMRDMMLYRTRSIQAPDEQATAALDLVKTMVDATADSNRFHDVHLRFFGDDLLTTSNLQSYLTHEYMEANNDPFYFHQFAADLNAHGLKYVCDAEQADFELDRLPAETAATFEDIAESSVDIEQYIDFLKNTRFRRSLVCRDNIEVDATFAGNRIEDLYAAADVIPVLDSPDSAVEEASVFKMPTGRTFRTRHRLAQLILTQLGAVRPCTLDVPTVIQTVAEQAPAESNLSARQHAEKIERMIYSLFFNGVVSLLSSPRRCVTAAGDHPNASSVARLLAPTQKVTSLCHRTITMDDPLACLLLSHLDGSHDHDSLANMIGQWIREGRVSLPPDASQKHEATPERIRRRLASMLDQMARCGFLVA